VLVANQIQRLEYELEKLESLARTARREDEEEAHFQARKRVVRGHLEIAEEAIKPAGPLQLLRDWYSGAAIETAWSSLHRASEELLMIQSPLALAAEEPDIEAAFEANLKAGDARYRKLAPALKEAEKVLLGEKPPNDVSDELRTKLLAARRAANVASDTAHDTVRKWRNVLLLAGFALGMLGVAVAIAHAFAPGFLSLVPSGQTKHADAIEPWAVELMGATGGAVAAVLALNRFSGFTDPSGLPTVQALIRIPMAVVISLFGVVLMQTATLDILKPQDGTKVLAYAFLFGYAQEPLLRLIDQQAGKVLDPARGKDEPIKRPTGEQGAPEGG
jgi:hypothetical protein